MSSSLPAIVPGARRDEDTWPVDWYGRVDERGSGGKEFVGRIEDAGR